LVLELLAAGQSESELLESYPGLRRENVLACLAFASRPGGQRGLAPERKPLV
jgi:uncharacterized protein (DUF433 family)